MQLRIKCDECGVESYREAIERPSADKGRVLLEVPPCENCRRLSLDAGAMVGHLSNSCNELDSFNAILVRHPDLGDVANTNEIGRRLKRVLFLLKQRMTSRGISVPEPEHPAKPKRKRVSHGVSSVA